MAIDIVDFPIKHGDVPWQNVSSPEGMPRFLQSHYEIAAPFMNGFLMIFAGMAMVVSVFTITLW